MKAVLWALGLLVVVVAGVFAVHNFAGVPIDLWPLPFTAELPLYAVILGAVFVGFVLGALTAWLSAGKWRRMARARQRAIESLRHDLAALRQSQAEARPQGVPGTAGERPGAVVPSRANTPAHG